MLSRVGSLNYLNLPLKTHRIFLLLLKTSLTGFFPSFCISVASKGEQSELWFLAQEREFQFYGFNPCSLSVLSHYISLFLGTFQANQNIVENVCIQLNMFIKWLADPDYIPRTQRWRKHDPISSEIQAAWRAPVPQAHEGGAFRADMALRPGGEAVHSPREARHRLAHPAVASGRKGLLLRVGPWRDDERVG